MEDLKNKTSDLIKWLGCKLNLIRAVLIANQIEKIKNEIKKTEEDKNLDRKTLKIKKEWLKENLNKGIENLEYICSIKNYFEKNEEKHYKNEIKKLLQRIVELKELYGEKK